MRTSTPTVRTIGRVFRVSPAGEAEEWERYTRSEAPPRMTLAEALRIFDDAHDARERGE